MSGIPVEIDYPVPGGSTLPRNHVQWDLDPERAVLLIHDMQRFFLRPFTGRLREHLVDNTAALRTWSRRNSVPVAYTAQPGDMSAEQRGLLRDFWGPGMRVAPEDRAVVPGLEPRDDDWVLTKWRYSAFFRSDLAERMRASGRDQIILTGVYAHVGVQATAVDAFSMDIAPFVVADATGDFDEGRHLQSLHYVAERCAMVVTTDQVLDAERSERVSPDALDQARTVLR